MPKASVVEKVSTFKVMSCATSHVTNRDINDLLERQDCPICAYSYDQGTFVFVSQVDLAGSVKAAKAFGLSDSFCQLLKLAAAAGCRYIQLDCDGIHYEDLPSFDW